MTWFPERGESAAPAKAVCARCLVLDTCAAWALNQGDGLAGVWGGLSEPDRAVVRRGRTIHYARTRKANAS